MPVIMNIIQGRALIEIATVQYDFFTDTQDVKLLSNLYWNNKSHSQPQQSA